MDHVLIFANPIAGRGRGKVIAESLRDEITARGHRVTMFLSRADPQSTVLPEGPIRAAIVIGGDGTLRTVAQFAIEKFLASCPATPESPACLPYPLLIVPMGTANLMGQHLGISWKRRHLARDVADTIENHRTAYLDIARAGDGVFLLVAGVGFDAWVIHEMNRVRKGPIHIAKYALPVIRTLTEYHFPNLSVTVDGQRVFDSAPALALVGNVSEYGTGFHVLPLARPDDQLLDVCVMPCASRTELVRLFVAAAAGEHLRQPGVVYVKGRHIRIESPEHVAVQVDGEAAGFTPVSIDLLPSRIPFIVPNRP